MFLDRCLAVALSVPPAGAQGSPRTSVPPPLALVGATLVDPARDVHAPGMTVLVEEGRIRAVFPTGEQELPEGTEVHDLDGRYLVPTRAAHRAGVTLAAGTDWFTPPEDPYPALHHEIEALVDLAGLTPAEALVAATLGGARALGREADYGTVEPGKIASLVVLRDDPARDVRALRTVVAVVHHGVLHPREQPAGSPE